jgi:hypothetical protein
MMRSGVTPTPSTSATAFAAAIAASTEQGLSPAGYLCHGITCCPKAIRVERDDPDYIVTSCMFCNVADNRYFGLAEKRGLRFDGLTPDELVAQRLRYVEATRQSYRKFWIQNVRARATTD